MLKNKNVRQELLLVFDGQIYTKKQKNCENVTVKNINEPPMDHENPTCL